MKNTRGVLLLLTLLFCFLCSANAQQTEINKDEINRRATTVFTQLLKSEEQAKHLVLRISIYGNRSPFDYNLIMTLAQRLVTNDYPHQDLFKLLEPCADMTVALNGDGELFAEIVLTMASLRVAESDEISSILYSLEGLGVPAYKLLALMIGKTESETKKLARQGRVRGNGTKDALLAAFNLKYKGLAEKVVNERKKS